jgi:hypothetical protein
MKVGLNTSLLKFSISSLIIISAITDKSASTLEHEVTSPKLFTWILCFKKKKNPDESPLRPKQGSIGIYRIFRCFLSMQATIGIQLPFERPRLPEITAITIKNVCHQDRMNQLYDLWKDEFERPINQ